MDAGVVDTTPCCFVRQYRGRSVLMRHVDRVTRSNGQRVIAIDGRKRSDWIGFGQRF
jgi:hypothetical protein